MTEYARRLSDKILFAFNQACDQGYHDVAEILLRDIPARLLMVPPPAPVEANQTLVSIVDERVVDDILQEVAST